jgi:hypothetical protein
MFEGDVIVSAIECVIIFVQIVLVSKAPPEHLVIAFVWPRINHGRDQCTVLAKTFFIMPPILLG